MTNLLIACRTRLIPVAIVIMILAHGSYAQRKPGVANGYIVINGTKQTGEIKTALRRTIQAVCTFRSGSDAQFKDYTADLVDSLFIEGEGLFVSRRSIKVGDREPASYFMHMLVAGRVKLMDVVDARNKLAFFIEKDGVLEELKNTIQTDRSDGGAIVKRRLNEYKRTLALAFSECPQGLERVDYFERHLTTVVAAYNKCVDPSFAYVRKKERRAISIGYLVGSTTDIVESSTRYDQIAVPPFLTPTSHDYFIDARDFRRNDKFASFVHGPTFDLALGKKNKHVYAFTALLFSAHDLQTTAYRFRYTRIDIPVTIRYNMFLRSPVRPFLSAGVVLPIITNNQSAVTSAPFFRTGSSTPSGTYAPVHPSDLEFNRLRVVGGAGIEIAATQNVNATLMVRADSSSSVSRANVVTMWMNTYVLAGVVSFRLN